MDYMILSVLSVVLFCVCCFQFMKNLINPLPKLNLEHYSKAALKFKRNYSILSWGLMTMTFLMGVVASFYQVYTEL